MQHFDANVLSTVLFCLESCHIQLKGAKQQQKTPTKNTVFSVAFCCLSQLPCEPVCCHFYTKHLWCHCWGSPLRAAVCWTSKPKELLGRADSPFFFISLEIKRCVQKWIITFQPHSSAFWSHCQEKEEEEPAFFYLFSCLCVAFIWLAQLCNEKVYERTAFTPDKCVRSVAERERGLSLLKIVTSSQMPGKFFQVLSLCEMLHMVKLIPLSRIALFCFFFFIYYAVSTQNHMQTKWK